MLPRRRGKLKETDIVEESRDVEGLPVDGLLHAAHLVKDGREVVGAQAMVDHGQCRYFSKIRLGFVGRSGVGRDQGREVHLLRPSPRDTEAPAHDPPESPS